MLTNRGNMVELGPQLGKGSYGVVHRGVLRTPEGENMDVTVKVYRPQNRKSCEQDTEIATSRVLGCGCINLLCLRDFGTLEGKCVAIYDYIHGAMDLSQVSLVNFDDFHLIQLLYGIANGVEHLHNSGFLHMDLKLDNILLKRNIPIVIDYGMACLQDGGCEGKTGGTLEYAAPELYSMQDPTTKTDIFAMGCIFYELLLNKFPFSGGVSEMARQKEEGKYPEIEVVRGGSEVKELIERMLFPTPELRPSASEVKEVLKRVLLRM